MPNNANSSSSRHACGQASLHIVGLLTPKCDFLLCKKYTLLACFMRYRLAFLHNCIVFMYNYSLSLFPYNNTFGGLRL